MAVPACKWLAVVNSTPPVGVPATLDCPVCIGKVIKLVVAVGAATISALFPTVAFEVIGSPV